MDVRTTPSPTDEQLDIISAIEATEDNILVNAYAGTGKTTTLEMIQSASPQQPVLCLAFNKAIADEMAKRFPSTTLVRTFNSLGHRIWMKAVSNVSLNPKKTQEILKETINEFKGEDKAELRDSYWPIVSAVGLAKSLGHVPSKNFPAARRLVDHSGFHASLEEKPSPLVAEVIDAILIASIKASYKGTIDFNDQVYMPALFGGSFPRFPHVLVDETQDLSPVNLAMLDKLVKGRLSAVGDRWQSIYGFRGAETNGIEILKQRFSMTEFGLTISFRCPEKVVEAARWRVPDFKWVKHGGTVESLRSLQARDIPEGAAVICRNNAPLFQMALNLLSARRSVQVAGSDIGPRIINLLQRIGAEHDTSKDLIAKIDGWVMEKLQTTQSPRTIHDMAECMKVFASFGSTLSQAVGYAKHLFAQQGTIQLLTGHKAKGREWNTVYHLNPWLIGQDDQELNLRYVITTRAKQELFEIDSREIQW